MKTNSPNSCCKKCLGAKTVAIDGRGTTDSLVTVPICKNPACPCHTNPQEEEWEKSCICNHSNKEDCYPKTRCACKIHGKFKTDEVEQLLLYIETNWQEMQGDTLVDVDPEKWFLSIIQQAWEEGRDEEAILCHTSQDYAGDGSVRCCDNGDMDEGTHPNHHMRRQCLLDIEWMEDKVCGIQSEDNSSYKDILLTALDSRKAEITKEIV